jgi:Cu-Zn family superoxide dismutase
LSGGKINLLDADGSAVVVHASPDDHLSQPIGGAGARVACAVLK